MNVTLDQSLAQKGQYLIDDTTTGTSAENYKVLVIREDSVLTALTDTNDTNILTASNFSGKTLVQGDVIGTGTDYPFKTVTFSSGSGFLIKG